MSDYKIVNGKKVRVCKYSCDTELVWSDDISGFIEQNGGVAHTKERCQHVKESKKPKQETTTQQDREAKIARIIKMVESVVFELEALKKEK